MRKYWKRGFLVVFTGELCYNFYEIVTRRQNKLHEKEAQEGFMGDNKE